ncbi:hypothetical protein TNIN_115651, partial [Trichonephila inaurata madagascariensis]
MFAEKIQHCEDIIVGSKRTNDVDRNEITRSSCDGCLSICLFLTWFSLVSATGCTECGMVDGIRVHSVPKKSFLQNE